MSGWLGSSASAPIDWAVCLSKIGRKVVPPSCDFHTPPEAAPTSSRVLPSGCTRPAMAAIRPLIVAEPMLRAPRPEMVALSNLAGAAAATLAEAAKTTEASTRRAAPLPEFISRAPRARAAA